MNIKKFDITLGLVAARKNSIGVKNKNLIKIDNQSITKTALNLALECKKVDKVVLSSDSRKILKLINKNKKLIKLKRDKSLSRNNTPMLPVIRNAVKYSEGVTQSRVSKIVIFDPTSPLRNLKDIENGLKVFDKKKPDLLLSVHDARHNPYFSIIEKKGKYYELCKYPHKNPGSRQQVPKAYEINTIVWIYSRNAIFKEKRRIPKRTLIILTSEERSIDIDTKSDIEKIKYYLNKRK